MTKEAEMLALTEARDAFAAIRLILIGHLEEPERSAFWKAVEGRNRAEMAMDNFRAAARPSPDAGLVERKPFGLERTGLKDRTSNIPEPIQDRDLVSQIIEPGIFAHDGSGSMVEFMGVTRRNSALGKADAILALLSSRAVAGEPVAAKFWYADHPLRPRPTFYLNENEAQRDTLGSVDQNQRPMKYAPLYATPAPSGRDPATIATVQFIRRDDGGLRVRSDDMPGLILSGSNADAVAADVWPAIRALPTPVVTEDG